MVAVVVAAAAGGAAGRVTSGLVLVVEDAAHARVLHEERVTIGQALTVSYVHSSERVPVRGTFRIEADGSLTATETRFAGVGPGLPALGPGDPWRVEDGMIVAATGVRLPELRLRVVPIAGHRLVTPAGHTLDLCAALGAGGPVRISVRQAPRSG